MRWTDAHFAATPYDGAMQGPPEADEPPASRAPRPSGRWHVRLLGDLHVRNGDHDLPRPAERAVRLLLARLALQPRVAHGRDRLAAELWPDLDDPELLRERLRRVLNKLNTLLKSVGAARVLPVLANRDELRLNAEAFEVDVWRFEQHVERREWAAARSAWGGTLLPGLDDPWIDAERERLAALRERADIEAATEAEPDAADEPLLPTPPPLPGFAPALAHPTRLVGRQAELEALRAALATHRLVNLVGPPGCGKSRLADEVPRGQRSFECVAVARLEDCRSAEQVFDEIRAGLDLRADGRPAGAQVIEWLQQRRALLVLDGFEHLVGAVGDAVLEPLLHELPLLRLLLTSRRALARADECVWALSPLPVPGEHDELDAARSNPSVALFVARAGAARDGFTLNGHNLRAVVEVCRLLEGLPLSIELAAAQVRTLAPWAMADALRRGIRLAARPQMRQRLAGRHVSLEAALEWSWRLLDDAARAMLRQLGPFRGGFTLPQLQAALPGEVVDLGVHALVRDSLLQVQPGAPQRLQLLVVVREFVEARCTPQELLALRRSHRAVFLALARRLEATHAWPDDEDQANFAEALASACADDAPDAALALVAALAAPWRARGAPPVVPTLLRRLADDATLPAVARAPAAQLLATLLVNAGQGREAHTEAQRGLRLSDPAPLPRAEALRVLADVHLRAARAPADIERAWQLAGEARALLEALPESPALLRLTGGLLMIQGPILLEQRGDPAGAMALFEQAERCFSRLGDRRAAVLALPGRTACLLHERRFAEVIAVSLKGDEETAALGAVVTRLQLFDRLSNAYDGLGRYAEAVQACQRQTRLALRHGLLYYGAYGAWNQLHGLAQSGSHVRAAQLLAFSCAYWERAVGELTGADRLYADRVGAMLREALGERRWRTEEAHGRALTVRAALELAAGRGADPDSPALA